MKKIPVLATIQAAYDFVFAHLGAIIGLIWLPMVLVTVSGFFVKQRAYAAAAEALASNNFALAGPAMLGVFCFFVAWLLFLAMILTPVTQLALGQRKDGVLVHIAFGPPEWRLFRALAGLAAFLVLPILFAGFFVDTALSLGGAAPNLLLRAGAELGVVLAYLAVIYVGLRFLFFMPAIAVSGDGPVLARAWKLGHGNFWRIFAVTLATAGPVELAAQIAKFAAEGRDVMMPALGNSSAMMAAQLHMMSLHMPVDQGIDFLFAPLLVGLMAGAAASGLTAMGGAGSTPLPSSSSPHS